MLKKFKGLMNVGQDMQKVSDSTKEQAAVLQDMKTTQIDMLQSLDLLKMEITSSRKLLQEQNEEMHQALYDLQSIREEYSQELAELKAFKSRLTQQLLNQLMEEFRLQLSDHMERVKSDAKKFQELRNELSQFSQHMQSLHAELAKLKAISIHLKEKDFELEKYAKTLLAYDREKVNLMKRVDELERLLAKERRERR